MQTIKSLLRAFVSFLGKKRFTIFASTSVGLALLESFSTILLSSAIIDKGNLKETLSRILGPNLALFPFIILLLILATTAASAFTNYYLTRQAVLFGGHVSTDLVRNALEPVKYPEPGYPQHEDLSRYTPTSHIIALATTESYRFTEFFLIPLFNLMSRGLIIVLYSSILLSLFFKTSCILLVCVLPLVILPAYALKPLLERLDSKINSFLSNQSRFVKLAFSNTSEIKLYNKANYLLDHYFSDWASYARTRSLASTSNSAPKYTIEILVLSVVILFTGILDINTGTNQFIEDITNPIFVVVAAKLVPSIQQALNYTAICLTNRKVFSSVTKSLKFHSQSSAIISSSKLYNPTHQDDKPEIDKASCIQVKNFYAWGESGYIIDGLTFRLYQSKLNFIVGPSGSGKSTLVTSLLNLNPNCRAEVSYKKSSIFHPCNLSSLSSSASYCTQSPLLIEGTLGQNISLSDNYDKNRVLSALQASSFFQFYPKDSLTSLVDKPIIGLSGGQLSILGFARALYQNSSLMFLDEITSSLDPDYKQLILAKLHELSASHIITIVTHDTHLIPAGSNIISL